MKTILGMAFATTLLGSAAIAFPALAQDAAAPADKPVATHHHHRHYHHRRGARSEAKSNDAEVEETKQLNEQQANMAQQNGGNR